MFQPTDCLYSIQNICKFIEEIENNKYREKFCAFICLYNFFGDCAQFAD